MKHPLIKLIILIAVAAAIYAGTLFYLDSRIPRATATVQVHPAMIVVHSQNPDAGVQMTRHYMESEFQTIPTKETKTLAATLLGIEESQHPAAIKLMDETVTAAPVRGTDFITITAKYPDPQQAINTANAIAEAYAQRRNKAEIHRANRALQALDEELLSQQEKVTEHQTDLQILIEANGHPPFSGDDTVDLSLKQHHYTQAKETYEQARGMLREMKIKQREERTRIKTPHQLITIHERATLTPSNR